ncbi:hypothetical protein V1504DRAFT_461197 [Lipomyces starkeyi]
MSVTGSSRTTSNVPPDYEYALLRSRPGGRPLASTLSMAGHRTLLIDAGEDQDPQALAWLETLLPPVIELSIFGGSITFAVAVGQYGNPRHFDKDLIETFLALGWLFFVLALGVASAAAMALSFQRPHIKEAFGNGGGVKGYKAWRDGETSPHQFNEKLACIMFVVVGVSEVLQLLILLAFMFLSLCIAAYCSAVGWFAVAYTIVMLIGAFYIWYRQNFSRYV